MKLYIPLIILAVAILSFACSDNASVSFNDKGPQFTNTDGDIEGELAEKESESLPQTCDEGDLACSGNTVVICNKDNDWLQVEECDSYQLCEEGKCIDKPADGDTIAPPVDGDGTTPTDGDSTTPIPDGDSTTPIPDGDTSVPDGDNWHCVEHQDCPYGEGCEINGAGDGCVLKMECMEDKDCPKEHKCIEAANWMMCEPLTDECIEDKDCKFGFKCEANDNGRNVCVDANECTKDEDCDPDWNCQRGDQWMVCKADIVGECKVHKDCDFGNRCNLDVSPSKCENANKCENDKDCQTAYTCETVENWRECKFNTSPDFCQQDADCGEGEFCDVVIGGYGTCKSLNKCDKDSDCPTYYECKYNGQFRECVETEPCKTNEDCGFGFKCETADPRNLCTYSNTCSKDEDCQLWEACEKVDNWMECKGSQPNICSNDDDCPDDQYCDTLLGPIGTCRSRNQCTIDDDCDTDMVCKSNGTYNECVLVTTQQCLLDSQCPTGFLCTDFVCVPKQTGICPDVEGKWTVFASSCMLLTMGQAYSFNPNDGCNGQVVNDATSLPMGTFTETSTSNYDLSLAFIMQCTAKVSVSMLMSVDCGSCTAQLGKL